MVETTTTPDATTNGTSGTFDETLDKLTGTTADDRQAFVAKAQETLSSAVATAVDAVKANPKTAAAIAAGATAAVAGAAYGATKLAKSSSASNKTSAKHKPTAKK